MGRSPCFGNAGERGLPVSAMQRREGFEIPLSPPSTPLPLPLLLPPARPLSLSHSLSFPLFPSPSPSLVSQSESQSHPGQHLIRLGTPQPGNSRWYHYPSFL